MRILELLAGVILLNGLNPAFDKTKFDLVNAIFLLIGFCSVGYILGAIAEGVNKK